MIGMMGSLVVAKKNIQQPGREIFRAHKTLLGSILMFLLIITFCSDMLHWGILAFASVSFNAKQSMDKKVDKFGQRSPSSLKGLFQSQTNQTRKISKYNAIETRQEIESLFNRF
eukprot:CCRYP_007393-RA/>CCRYP_007393-RA protein AED:0.17 eAED:0.12 QI:0/0/0/1/0/0/3/0/113